MSSEESVRQRMERLLDEQIITMMEEGDPEARTAAFMNMVRQRISQLPDGASDSPIEDQLRRLRERAAATVPAVPPVSTEDDGV